MEKVYLLSDEVTFLKGYASSNCEILSLGYYTFENGQIQVTAPSIEEGLCRKELRKSQGYQKAICLYSAYPGVNMKYYYEMFFQQQEAILFDTGTLFPATTIYLCCALNLIEQGKSAEDVVKALERLKDSVRLLFVDLHPTAQRILKNSKVGKCEKMGKGKFFQKYPIYSVNSSGEVIFSAEEWTWHGAVDKMKEMTAQVVKSSSVNMMALAGDNSVVEEMDFSRGKKLWKEERYFLDDIPYPVKLLYGENFLAFATGNCPIWSEMSKHDG